ncbi:unnamed protein product [Cunninghamella echinulata]
MDASKLVSTIANYMTLLKHEMLILSTLLFAASVSASCNYITQQPNQYCWDLAQACQITADQLYQYNPNLKTDCSGLIAGQKVCCTSGGLAPSPNPDGSCAVYKAQAGDYCNKIAADHGLSVDQLLQYNQQTWGWLGCENLQLDMNICISSGTPPRPTPDPTATCGMTAPGDLYGKGCPLNACCSQWGYCGVSEEFCATKTSVTNNPGTTGCQSHCEIGYHANTGPPSEFIKIGYYETWNLNRACSRMDMTQLQTLIDQEHYTHIHYAFGVISDYNAKVEDMTMWNQFLALRNVKKVISFGGWAFSTEDGTRPIFGDAVLTDQFVHSLVNMAAQYNLDGIDIDWEYPGATDLKGWADSTPTVHPNDGENYVNFLTKLRAALPSHVSVSICAPASFWYLKNFPIDRMNAHLDYIVFMTYDLHGQWDINIESLGPKLLSHVNKTETINALAMITKAGMDSNKVVMGVASYGRAFWQSDPNCSGPTCTFTAQGATPGQCTKESSYLGYGEIEDIILSGNIRNMYYDAESDSDILLYNTNDWVAYTNLTTTMPRRYEMARNMNLKGTVEWAVDLRAGGSNIEESNDWGTGGYSYYDDDEYEALYSIEGCPDNIQTLDDADNVEGRCVFYALTQAMYKMLDSDVNKFNTMMDPNIEYTYTKLYTEKYKPYVFDIAKIDHRDFFDTSTIDNNALNKYFNCGNNCQNGGSVSLQISLDNLTDVFSKEVGQPYAFMNADYQFPYAFDYDRGQNMIQFTNFPIVNPEESFPDPSDYIIKNKDNILNTHIFMLASMYNKEDIDFEEVYYSTIYNVLAVHEAVEGMKQIMEIEIVVGFVPTIGGLLSAALGLLFTFADDQHDTLDIVFAAGGAIGEIASVFRMSNKLGAISSKVGSLVIGEKISSLKRFNNNPIYTRGNNIGTKAPNILSDICNI